MPRAAANTAMAMAASAALLAAAPATAAASAHGPPTMEALIRMRGAASLHDSLDEGNATAMMSRRLQGPESAQLASCNLNGCWYGGLWDQFIPGLWVTHPNIYWRCVNPGQVALTFDDGPTQYTKAILDELDEAKAVATFFIVGLELERQPHLRSLLTRAEAAGHVVASHSHLHVSYLNKATKDSTGAWTKEAVDFVRGEIDNMTKATKGLLPRAGLRPYFRPPYMEIDAAAADLLQKYGIYVVQITTDARDYAPDATRESVETRILKSLSQERPDAYSYITLQLETRSFTAGTIKNIVKQGRAYGYEFVGMDQCLGLAQPLPNLCSGRPCPNRAHCRSKVGTCGAGSAFCQGAAQWKPECDNNPFNPCQGKPCTDETHCRSKWGSCGVGAEYCDDHPEWKPECKPQSTVPCRGKSCDDKTHCRSRWGDCGAGAIFCEDNPQWIPMCDSCGNPPCVVATSAKPSAPPKPSTSAKPPAQGPQMETLPAGFASRHHGLQKMVLPAVLLLQAFTALAQQGNLRGGGL